MALREDYKDALFDGSRRYQMVQNDDGTYTLLDVTSYTQEGDRFGAADINTTNAVINEHIAATGNLHKVTAEQVGASPSGHTHTAADVGAAEASHKHAAGDIASGIFEIIRGGTGANSRIGAFKNLSYIGYQPIASTDDDTQANWAALGSGMAIYATPGLLIDQPNQYGFLINYTDGGTEVCQLWLCRPSGSIYVRGGNGSGWSGTWKKLFDDSQVISVSNGGTGKVSFPNGEALVGAGTNAVTSRPITNNTSVASVSGTNIPTCNTVNFHVRDWLNRDTQVDYADTGYNAYRARGIALVTAVPSSLTNGTCAFVYE